MAAASASTSSSLKEYLKKYEASGQDEQKKKRKKKKAVKPASALSEGVLIVDEDPVWAKPVIHEVEEESEGEETPVIDEDIEVKRLRRLELLRSRKPYHAISEDGSGWVSVSDEPRRLSSSMEKPDLSPPRQRRTRFDTPSPSRGDSGPLSDNGSGDLSPLRQQRRHYDSPPLEPEGKASSSGSKGVPNLSPPQRREVGEDILPPRRGRDLSDELSPPRRSKTDVLEDLSPPRRDKKYSTKGLSPPRRQTKASSEDLSQVRRGRKGSPEDLSPPRRRRKGSLQDLSPPRRVKKGSSEDLSPPRRGRKGSPEDLSPRRRGKKGSPEDLSPPRRGRKGSLEDLSPLRRERKSWSEDLSLPRRVRHNLLEANRPRESGERDLSPPRRSKRAFGEGFSPPRRSHHSPDADFSPSRESKKKRVSAEEERRAGLFTGQEIKEEIERKKKEEISRFAALDPALSGRGAEPIYRDKEGKRISKEELLKMQTEEEKPKEKTLEWGKGLVQKREAEARASELELEKEKPFARSRDDPELDKMMRERPRWGDPMAHLIKKKHSEFVFEDFGVDEKMKESGFIIPQTIPSHSWIKRGIDPPANRYGIQPGRHWDGVDRSSGYEKETFKRQNEKRATETESYLWSVSDM